MNRGEAPAAVRPAGQLQLFGGGRRRVLVALALLSGALAGAALSPRPAFADLFNVPDPVLYSISCPSSSLCAAGDSRGQVVTSSDLTTATPTWIATGNAGDAPYLGGPPIMSISCPSTTLCVGIDLNGRALISTNPASATPTWSAPTSLGGLDIVESISCPSTSLCVAVDDQERAVTLTDLTAAASTWSVTTVDGKAPASFGNGAQSFVSCPSTSLCVAVNSRGDAMTLTDPGSVKASWSAPAHIDAAGLTGVSCPSASLCVAIDRAGGAAISTDPSDAAPTWKILAGIDTVELVGVTCPSTSLCVAVDDAGRAVISTDPSSAAPTWSAVPPLVGGSERVKPSISCGSTSLCVIVKGSGAVISTDPTAPTPTWRAEWPIVALPAGTPSVLGPPVASGATLSFGFACTSNAFGAPTGGFQECDGAALVTTAERLARNGRVAGISATATTKRRRVVAVGRATFAAGSTSAPPTIELTLDSAGKRLLARFKRLPATLSVTADASELRVPAKTVPVASARVTFRAKAKAKKTKKKARTRASR
jgi:hypothetical protein